MLTGTRKDCRVTFKRFHLLMFSSFLLLIPWETIRERVVGDTGSRGGGGGVVRGI